MTLVVVPTEGQVEVCALRGERAMTRAALRQKLLDALVRDVVFAPEGAVRLLLAEIATSLARDDRALARLLQTGGMGWERTIDAMARAIRAFRRGLVQAKDLRAVGATSQARILEALDARLAAAKLVDPDRASEVLASAIERASRDRVREIVRADRVVARHIIAWEPADAAWFRALGGSIEMPLLDRPLDAARRAGPIDAVLDDVALVMGEPPQPVPLARAPLGDGSGAGVDPSIVSVAVAVDAEAQGRAVRDAVLAALGAGASIDRIAIACLDESEQIAGAIRRAMIDAAVPVHDAIGSVLADTGITHVARTALELGEEGLPRAKVAALLRSRYIDPRLLSGLGGWWEARQALDDLAHVLDKTPTAAGATPIDRLEQTARSCPHDDEEQAGSRGALARRIGEILGTSARTIGEHVARTRSLFRALGIAPVHGGIPTLARDEPAAGIERAELESLARDARAWDALGDAIDRIERTARALGVTDNECSLHAFLHAIFGELQSPEPLSAAGRAGALRMGRAADFVGGEFDCAIIVEASAATLDSADTLPIPEIVAARLVERQPERVPRALRAVPRTAVELVALAERAERIVLVLRSRTADGSESAPSALVRGAEKVGCARSTWTSSPLPERPRTDRERRLAAIATLPEHDALALAESAVRRARLEAAREAWHASRDDEETRAAAGWIAPRARPIIVAETGGAGRPLSVTALERFARCPFQGFAHLLTGSAVVATRDTPDAREEGNLVHEALRIAFEKIGPDLAKRPRDTQALVKDALDAVSDVLGRVEHASTLRQVALVRAREEVEQVVRAAAADDAWDFALAEQAFGGRDGWPALVLGKGAITLRGIIDRIDVAHGDPRIVRVLDYKRRQDHVPPSELGKKRLQLLVYGLAAARAKGAHTFCGAYVPTRSPHEAASETFAQAWRAWANEDAIEARVVEIVGAVRDGDVLPRPGHACSQCPFDGACRKPRFSVAEEMSSEKQAMPEEGA